MDPIFPDSRLTCLTVNAELCGEDYSFYLQGLASIVYIEKAGHKHGRSYQIFAYTRFVAFSGHYIKYNNVCASMELGLRDVPG